MKKTLLLVAFGILLAGAGCSNLNQTSMNQENLIERGKLELTTEPQKLEFYVNTVPYTGGPQWRMMDLASHEEKTWDGNVITVNADDMKQILSKVQNPGGDVYAIVKAKIQLEEKKDQNTSVPGAPEFKFYEAKILELESVSL